MIRAISAGCADHARVPTSVLPHACGERRPRRSPLSARLRVSSRLTAMAPTTRLFFLFLPRLLRIPTLASFVGGMSSLRSATSDPRPPRAVPLLPPGSRIGGNAPRDVATTGAIQPADLPRHRLLGDDPTHAPGNDYA